ncbi:MAG: hypothetical protein RI565_11080 [Schleiferiaceae bacterium]|nr:hypothetical protein [Schleiferiaceae bacterium]
MKKLIFAATLLLATNALLGQNPLKSNLNQFKDTLVLNGEKIGQLQDVDVSSGEEGQYERITLSLYRDITKAEKTLISDGYTADKGVTGHVNFSYDYQFNSTKEKAGHLLFEAGRLKTQSTNLFLTAGIVAAAGTVLSGIQAANAENGGSSTVIPIVTVSSSTLFSIIGLVKSYQANRKIREAGVFLQRP